MKKILLSCACCLLALGLVTACDEEDKVEDDGGVEEGGVTTDEALYFGFILDGTLTVIDGTVNPDYEYDGVLTTTLSEAVTVNVEEGSGSAYYISFEKDGVTNYITTVASGDYVNLSYTTTKSPIYLHTTDAGAEYFGDEDGSHFLSYYYSSLYCSDAKYIGTNEVAGVYKADGSLVLGGKEGTTTVQNVYETGESGDTSYPVSLHYSYVFGKDDKGSTTSGEVTTHELNGLTWTIGDVPYWGFDSTTGRGLQVGSAKNPASGVTFSTDFGTTVKLVSLSVNVSVAYNEGNGAGTVTTTLDSSTLQTITLSAAGDTGTSATDYPATLSGSETGQVLGISFTSSNSALYIKSVEFTVYMPAAE